jgi:hypothetical protein
MCQTKRRLVISGYSIAVMIEARAPPERVGVHVRLRRPAVRELDVRCAAVGPVPQKHLDAAVRQLLGERLDPWKVLRETPSGG